MVASPVRDAAPGDYDAYVALERELGIDDPPAAPEAWRADNMPRTVMYERAGRVVGYATYRLLGEEAHLVHLAVAADARRSGVGRALMHAAAARMRAAGASAWFLNVKVGNVAAIRLYESLGMSEKYASTVVRVAWTDVARLALQAPDAVMAAVAAEDDAELERIFDLVAGRLAARRARGRVILQLREHGAFVGVASFAAHGPGAYPFRVTRAALAGVLLAAMQPHARPDEAWVQVIVENDVTVVSASSPRGAASTSTCCTTAARLGEQRGGWHGFVRRRGLRRGWRGIRGGWREARDECSGRSRRTSRHPRRTSRGS